VLTFESFLTSQSPTHRNTVIRCQIRAPLRFGKQILTNHILLKAGLFLTKLLVQNQKELRAATILFTLVVVVVFVDCALKSNFVGKTTSLQSPPRICWLCSLRESKYQNEKWYYVYSDPVITYNLWIFYYSASFTAGQPESDL
jgi:hypothetical protein